MHFRCVSEVKLIESSHNVYRCCSEEVKFIETEYLDLQEEETIAGTDGMFGHERLFTCAPKHAFFTHLHRVRRDTRFLECSYLIQRTDSQG